MPNKYKRKEGAKARNLVPSDILKLAVNRAASGEPLHTIAKEYGLSRNTLRRYVRKIQRGESTTFSSGYNKSQVFTDEEEVELSNYLQVMARMNHGLTTNVVDKLAYDLALKNNKKYPKSWDTDKKAGYFWRRGFISRHPELSLKKPEATSLSRATSFNKHNVSQFFKNLACVLEREHFGPESIWNADETGVTTVQKCSKVIAPKQLRQVGHVTSAERGHLVTVCNAVSALGNSIPPFFVFPRVKTNPAFLFGAPVGSESSAHISGWMTEENFINFLKHFKKHTRCSLKSKVLLLIDNHESHLSLGAIDFARENGIVILTFPPHCSHRLQPLDVSVYSSFKNFYHQSCTHRLTIEKPGIPLTIYNVAELVGKAFHKAFTPVNIISGFRKTGIWPFDDNIFTEEDFLCAYITDRPQESENEVYSQPGPSSSHAEPICEPAKSNGVDKQIGLLSYDGDVTTPLNKQLAHGFVISPEDILPYPKAGQRKTIGQGKGRKKGKTMIATDTPNKKEIEMEHRIKQEKKTKQAERSENAKKRLQFPGKKRNPETSDESNHKKKKPNPIDETSTSSDSDIDLRSDSENEFDLIKPLKDKAFAVDDWVVVKFTVKKNLRRFVGKVIEGSKEGRGISVMFARRCDGNRYKWPENEDLAEVDIDQVEARLSPPEFSFKNDRVTSFTFNHIFPYIIE